MAPKNQILLSLFTAISLMGLSACGGGGGGGSASSGGGSGDNKVWIQTNAGSFETPTIAATYTYSSIPGFTFAVRYLYPLDLDDDGIDELLVAGFETQPNTPTNYKNTKISLLGWRNGEFVNLTSQWLPNNADQVEGVGDIAVGDFNNDGRLDIYLSAYADMTFNVNAYQLINKGGYFEKSAIESVVGWQHGVSAADINLDGYMDVFAVGYGDSPRIYLGGPSGLTSRSFSIYAGGSGVAMADFLNDGTITAFIVDHGNDRAQNSVLMRLVDDGIGGYSLSSIATPPGPLLGDIGHNVRSKAFDFNDDGLMDVLVFTRENWNGSQWPTNSRIQFLKNNGGGQFIDVTTDVLVGYATNSNVSYSPVFIDLNRDGRTDIFISEGQFGASNSTAMLINSSDGKFTDTGRAQLSGQVSSNGGMATALRGPNRKLYFAFENQSRGGSATLSLSEFVPR
jgi:hypothetical protein